jgi:hypothetical protein
MVLSAHGKHVHVIDVGKTENLAHIRMSGSLLFEKELYINRFD